MREEFKKLKERMQRAAPKKNDGDDKSTPKTEKAEGDKPANIDDERREIMQKGRKFIRPLGMSRQKVLKVTGAIVGALVVLALVIFGVLIYRYESDSDLVYRASQILPYPAARVDGRFISYSDYLFELKSSKNYYEFQYNNSQAAGGSNQPIDFTTEEGQAMLDDIKRQAYISAKSKLIIKEAAKEEGISVSRSEVNEQLQEVIENNGGEEQVVEVIDDYWGWDMSDLRREVRIQVLQQKLQKAYSQDKLAAAEEILARAKGDEDFAELAKEHSEDPGSAEQGGAIDVPIDEQAQLLPEFKEAALKLEPGQVSEIVETDAGYHIIKATGRNDEGKILVSHILFRYEDVQPQLNERLQGAAETLYIDIPQLDATEEEAAPEEAAPAA